MSFKETALQSALNLLYKTMEVIRDKKAFGPDDGMLSPVQCEDAPMETGEGPCQGCLFQKINMP